MPERIIFHIDVNSAFLSWTACDLLLNKKLDYDLRDVPSIIGGNQETRHGIVLAKSGPAKRYGISTGEPVVDAKKKCPELVIYPPDYDLYVRRSRDLMELLKSLTPDVDQYSIDEAFCDFTGFELLYGKPVVFAEQLREKIKNELGFTVNIGASDNKLLAKMASDFKKPDRVHTLFPWEIKEKMWPLPVGDLFFVGSSSKRKLKELGIKTIGDLACTDPDVLTTHFKSHGLTLWRYANGYDLELPTEDQIQNKGYGNSMTIRFDVTDSETAKHYLLSLTETVASRIRADKAMISVVAVSITDNDFRRYSHQMTLPAPTDITDKIYKAACRLFDEMWDEIPIRQLGVHTSRATNEGYYQYDLFDGDRIDKLRAVDSAVDEIRSRYGFEYIKRASFIDDDKRAGFSNFIKNVDK
ncbi:MAG: DNA polymerase IV [Lachnospiraceae bacterium]|nr:DNA polymerase IV [Lachnospiraceae bacterium]